MKRSIAEKPDRNLPADRAPFGEQNRSERPATVGKQSRVFPMSFAQQRLWFLDQLEPNSSAYNIPNGVRLEGPLHTNSLERSLKEIVRRHEALRTSFSIKDGQPVQVISPSARVTL